MTRDGALLLGLVVVVALAVATGSGPTTTAKKKLTRAQLVALARDAGFPEAEVEHAADIAMRESGGNPSAVLDTRGRTDLPKGQLPENSIGLWQINLLAWPEFSRAELLNAKGNARAALKIWKRAGWAPWSTHRPDE
jgi:hypothetical protein